MIKFGDLMEFRMQSYHGAPEPMFVYVSALFSEDPADKEIEGIDMTKLGDPEEIERNIKNRLGQYQQNIRDLIGSMQESIDEMKAEMEGTS